MESCKYTQVGETNQEEEKERKSWTPFLRQLLVFSGLFITYFVTGMWLGASTVVIPQLRANTTVTDEMASWLSSTLCYSSLPWVVILPMVSHRVGRKLPIQISVTSSIISCFIIYFGHNTIHLLISLIFQGILFASNLTVSIILLTEYTSPKYRGMFLAIKSSNIWWGVWASNAIGTFFKWNYIGLVGLICSTFYVTILIWPESPHWLATNSRFDECRKSHRWLKGVSKQSEEELRELIESQRVYLKNELGNVAERDNIRDYIAMIKLKQFYRPTLLSILVLIQYYSLGKLVCSIYSIDLIKKMTESESAAYAGMLILDGVSVAGMYTGSVISKFVKRRTMLLVPSCVGIVCLFCISFHVWLIEHSYVVENKIVSIALLAVFSLSLSCGPMIMSLSIYVELIPLRFKSTAIIITTFVNYTLMGTVIKIAPFIFKTCSLFGSFLLFGTMSLVLTIILFKYLPETKDKTFQEIEEYFK